MSADLGYEPEYIHCGVCGFLCKLGRDTLASTAEDGFIVGDTTTNGTITAGDVSITVVSTATFESSGVAFIYASDAETRDRFSYTGKTATTFTGIPTSGDCAVEAHATSGLVVCDCNPRVTRGCPGCGSMNWLAGHPKVAC